MCDRLGKRLGPCSIDRRGDLNCPTDEFDNFVRCGHQRDVDKAPLNLCPVVPSLPTKARRICIKRLMKNADHYKFAGGATRRLSQLLKEVDVISLLRC